jgi:alkane 1-monooxygenase
MLEIVNLLEHYGMLRQLVVPRPWPLRLHEVIDKPPLREASVAAGGAPTTDPTVQHFTGPVEAARCTGCGYTYSVESGDGSEGFPAGTAWAQIPDDWCCPDCGVREKVDFVPLTTQEV